MRVITLKITPYSPTKAYIHSLVEGEIDYGLQYEIPGKEYELEIHEKRIKRTLTANAYYQVLLDKLTHLMRAPREEIHEMILSRYGKTKEIEGRPILFTLRADINPHYVSKYVEAIKTEEMNGNDFTVYRVLKGSSEMDSKEFACLLDGLISECKEVGIETMTPEEVARLKFE